MSFPARSYLFVRPPIVIAAAAPASNNAEIVGAGAQQERVFLPDQRPEQCYAQHASGLPRGIENARCYA